MKSIIVKTGAKPAYLQKAIRKVSCSTGIEVKLNQKFAFKNFGYQELVFEEDLQDHRPSRLKECDNPNEGTRDVFQRVMRSLAEMKVWVTCQNVTIVTGAGQTTEKAVGARYNGYALKMTCRGCKHLETCVAANSGLEEQFIVCDNMQPDYDNQRLLNLGVDGADRYGFMRSGKTFTRFDAKRWFTDGVPDEDGDLEFEHEEWGHSECYSNYKHHNRKRFGLMFSEFDPERMVVIHERRVKKPKETFEPSSDDFATLTGQALFDALNADNKRPKSKLK